MGGTWHKCILAILTIWISAERMHGMATVPFGRILESGSANGHKRNEVVLVALMRSAEIKVSYHST